MLPAVDHATGQRVSPKDAASFAVVVAGLPDVEGALLFESDVAFYEWGAESRYAKELAEDRQRLEQLRRLNRAGRSSHLADRMQVQQTIQSHLQALSKKTGLPIESKELLEKASRMPEIRQLTRDPISLYRGDGFTGAHYTLWGDHPDFSAVNFNNATSSVKLFFSPFGTLFDRSYYRGRRFVMFGLALPVPYFEVTRLSDVAFDNIASSYLQVAVLF